MFLWKPRVVGKGSLLLLHLTLKQKKMFFLLKKWVRVVCSVKLIIPNLSVKMRISNWPDHTNSPYHSGEKTVPVFITKKHMHYHKLFWGITQLNSWLLMLIRNMSIFDKFNNQKIKLYPSRSLLAFLTSIKINQLVFPSLPIPSV